MKRVSDNKVYALKKVINMQSINLIMQVSLSKLSEKDKENSLNEVRILASIK